jgi:hypothetical protein
VYGVKNTIKKKYNMRNSGYILDKPIDYSPSKYGSLKTHVRNEFIYKISNRVTDISKYNLNILTSNYFGNCTIIKIKY